MRAQRYDAVGAPVELVEVAAPACPDDGVVIDVRASGVCRSDWHAWRGHDSVPLPMIPGHEFAGVVAAVGPAVRRFAGGERVTVPFVLGCGVCDWCRSGQAQVCPNQRQPGFTDPGSFAEQVAIPRADFNLVRLPDALDFVTAASLGCRYATAFHALTTQAAVAAKEWVAVFGCGGLGLAAVQIAAARGARVVAVDVSPDALDRATALGAELTLDASEGREVTADVAAATSGGVHVGVDALGSAATASASVRSLRRRGRHLQVGLMLGEQARAPLPWDLVVARELRVIGSHGMPAVAYPEMLDLIAAKVLRPELLLAEVIQLADAGAALMAMDGPASRPGVVVARVD